MHHEADDKRPRAVEVRLVEGEFPRVVVLDVGDAGSELEHRATDQEDQAQALETVGHRAQTRPLGEIRDDRPELGQKDRDQGETRGTVFPG